MNAGKLLSEVVKELFNDPNIANKAIFKHEDKFFIFNKFLLYKNNEEWVIDSNFRFNYPLVFTSVKIALIWCVFINNKQYDIANKIKVLDSKLGNIQNSIDLYQIQLLDSNLDPELKVTLIDRLNNSVRFLRRYKGEIDKCARMAKYIETKKDG